MNIVIMESLGVPANELDALKAPFEAQGHVFREYPRTADVSTLIDEAKDTDVMILANMPMPAQVLDACMKLKFVDIAFTGVDHVAMNSLKARGIAASNASGYSNEAVAELSVALALGLLRNIPKVEARCRKGGTKDGLVGCELRGKTVGIVGLGKIGRRAAELYHAFGCEIVATSRSTHSDCPEYVKEVSLEELLRHSDVVSLHCPLNDSTRGLIGKEALALMKPTAVLLNLARGPVVNSADLAEALNSGVIAGAGVDVFDVEPPLPNTEPLLRAKNCILTPHVAFATKESMSLRAGIVFENLRAWMDGAQINIV